MGIGGEAMSWEAIRALPLCKARLSANGKVASLYIPGEDLEVAEAFHPPIWRSHHPSEPSVFDVYQAAAGARALLEEHDRAVELLRDAHSAFVYNNDTGIVELQCADKIAVKVDEFLRELEGE